MVLEVCVSTPDPVGRRNIFNNNNNNSCSADQFSGKKRRAPPRRPTWHHQSHNTNNSTAGSIGGRGEYNFKSLLSVGGVVGGRRHSSPCKLQALAADPIILSSSSQSTGPHEGNDLTPDLLSNATELPTGTTTLDSVITYNSSGGVGGDYSNSCCFDLGHHHHQHQQQQQQQQCKRFKSFHSYSSGPLTMAISPTANSGSDDNDDTIEVHLSPLDKDVINDQSVDNGISTLRSEDHLPSLCEIAALAVTPPRPRHRRRRQHQNDTTTPTTTSVTQSYQSSHSSSRPDTTTLNVGADSLGNEVLKATNSMATLEKGGVLSSPFSSLLKWLPSEPIGARMNFDPQSTPVLQGVDNHRANHEKTNLHDHSDDLTTFSTPPHRISLVTSSAATHNGSINCVGSPTHRKSSRHPVSKTVGVGRDHSINDTNNRSVHVSSSRCVETSSPTSIRRSVSSSTVPTTPSSLLTLINIDQNINNNCYKNQQTTTRRCSSLITTATSTTSTILTTTLPLLASPPPSMAMIKKMSKAKIETTISNQAQLGGLVMSDDDDSSMRFNNKRIAVDLSKSEQGGSCSSDEVDSYESCEGMSTSSSVWNATGGRLKLPEFPPPHGMTGDESSLRKAGAKDEMTSSSSSLNYPNRSSSLSGPTPSTKAPGPWSPMTASSPLSQIHRMSSPSSSSRQRASVLNRYRTPSPPLILRSARSQCQLAMSVSDPATPVLTDRKEMDDIDRDSFGTSGKSDSTSRPTPTTPTNHSIGKRSICSAPTSPLRTPPAPRRPSRSAQSIAHAVSRNRRREVEEAIAAGEDPNCPISIWDATTGERELVHPLLGAAKLSTPGVVRSLLVGGAVAQAVDSSGRTALHTLCMHPPLLPERWAGVVSSSKSKEGLMGKGGGGPNKDASLHKAKLGERALKPAKMTKPWMELTAFLESCSHTAGATDVKKAEVKVDKIKEEKASYSTSDDESNIIARLETPPRRHRHRQQAVENDEDDDDATEAAICTSSYLRGGSRAAAIQFRSLSQFPTIPMNVNTANQYLDTMHSNNNNGCVNGSGTNDGGCHSFDNSNTVGDYNNHETERSLLDEDENCSPEFSGSLFRRMESREGEDMEGPQSVSPLKSSPLFATRPSFRRQIGTRATHLQHLNSSVDDCTPRAVPSAHRHFSLSVLGHEDEAALREEQLALSADLLALYGTDVFHRDVKGHTALDYALQFGHLKVAEVLERWERQIGSGRRQSDGSKPHGTAMLSSEMLGHRLAAEGRDHQKVSKDLGQSQCPKDDVAKVGRVACRPATEERRMTRRRRGDGATYGKTGGNATPSGASLGLSVNFPPGGAGSRLMSESAEELMAARRRFDVHEGVR